MSINATKPFVALDVIVLSRDEAAFREIESAIRHSQSTPEISLSLRFVPIHAESVRSIEFGNKSLLYILNLDEETLKIDALAEVLVPVFRGFSARPAMMVLPWLHGINVSQLEDMARNGIPLAEAVIENIHVDKSLESLEGVVDAVKRHLEVFWLREEDAIFTSFSARIAWHAAWVVWIMAAALIVLGQLVWLSIKDPDSEWARFVVWSKPMSVMILLAFVVFWFDCFWRSLLTFVAMSFGVMPRYLIIITQALTVLFMWQMLGPTVTLFALSNSWMPAVLGAGLGVVMISILRASRRMNGSTNFASMPDFLVMPEVMTEFYPWAIRRFTITGKRMLCLPRKSFFISYSRSSPWCVKIAVELSEMLTSTTSSVFMDRNSLRPGEAWKARIGTTLDEVEGFVIILDSKACQKEWVVSEMLAALMARVMWQSPKVTIIHPPGFDPLKADGSRPAKVLSTLLNTIEERQMWWLAPVYIPIHEGADLKATSQSIRRHAANNLLAWVRLLLVFGVSVLVVPLSMVMLLVGFLIHTSPILFPSLESNHHLDVLSVIQGSSLMTMLAFALLAFNAGYLIPLSFFSLTRKGGGRMSGLMLSLCYLAVLARLYTSFHFDTIAVASLSFYFGLCCSDACNRLLRTKRDWDLMRGKR